MFVVPLKVWCRKQAGGWRNIGLDDYATIAALALANAFFYVCIIGAYFSGDTISLGLLIDLPSDMRISLGLHITTITNPFQIIDFLKNIYIANLLYTCCITCTKLSILGFYWRLFSLKARYVIYATLGAVIAWWIAIVCFP